MRSNKTFSDGYNIFFDAVGGQKAYRGAGYVQSVQSEIAKHEQHINAYDGKKQIPGILKGDIAEWWHSDTLNINSVIKDTPDRTYVNTAERNKLGSVDIRTNFGKDIGSKYGASGAKTAQEQAISNMEKFKRFQTRNPSATLEDYNKINKININDSNKHDPLYEGQERLVPADQLEEAAEFLKRRIARNSVSHPELVKKDLETLDRLTDRIKSGRGVESDPLTKSDAEEIARLGKMGEYKASDFGISEEEKIRFQNIMQQSLKAGLSAVTISMVLRLAPDLFKLLQKVIQDEEIEAKDFIKLGSSAVMGGAEGFVRGGIAAGITIACKSGKLGSFLKSADPTIIGLVTVLTLNAIKNSIRVARKEMTSREFANACMKDLFVSTASLALGGAAQSFIHIPVFGYMLGSFVGSIAASFIYDTAYKKALSFCCDTGFTFFGLVDQNYTLPDEIIREIGLDVFEFDKFEFDEYEFDENKFDKYEFDEYEFDKFNEESSDQGRLNITILRRGVIGINKIGYV